MEVLGSAFVGGVGGRDGVEQPLEEGRPAGVGLVQHQPGPSPEQRAELQAPLEEQREECDDSSSRCLYAGVSLPVHRSQRGARLQGALAASVGVARGTLLAVMWCSNRVGCVV